MATINLPAHVKFDNTIGAAIIGFAASSMYVPDAHWAKVLAHKMHRVYGVLCAQIWTYYHLSFHKVDKYYKFLVSVCTVMGPPNHDTPLGTSSIVRVICHAP